MELSYELVDQEGWLDKVAVLKMKGQLDRAFHPEMDDALQAAMDKGLRHIAVDLSGLEYLSSSGIAALVNLKGRLDRVTGSLCFFGADGRVSKVMDVMGMKRAYIFFDTQDQARQAFPSPSA